MLTLWDVLQKISYMTHGGLCGTARYLLFLNEYTETKAQQFVYHTNEMMHSSCHMTEQQRSFCCTSVFVDSVFILYLPLFFHLGVLLSLFFQLGVLLSLFFLLGVLLALFFHLGVLLLMLPASSWTLLRPVLWQSSVLCNESLGLGSL